ncbi:hypothetical protein PM082_020971 [Marasmius tenuissimus]|nr:hypothetical protein PM082_020971 [Marasmius tenuissimus]
MPTSILSVSLANVAVETLLFGVFLTLVSISISLQVLLLRTGSFCPSALKSLGSSRLLAMLLKRPMFVVSLALLVSVPGHWICTIIRLFSASVYFDQESGTSFNASAYYLDASRPPFVAKTAFMIMSACLCDGTIIYRLWVIWNSNYRVIVFPTLCLATLAGTSEDALLFTPIKLGE